MCGPWVLPMALMLGGSVAQYVGQKQAGDAQMNRWQEERSRQQRFSQEQQGHFEDSLARAGAVASPEAERAAAERREATLASVIRPESPASYLPGSSSANEVVRTAGERAGAEQRAQSEALADALGRLGGTGDQLLEANIQNSRNAGRIGQVGSFMRGSAAAGEAEVRAAAHKGAALRNLGALAQMFGQAMAGRVGGTKPVGAPGAGGMGALAELFGNPQGSVSWAYGS